MWYAIAFCAGALVGCAWALVGFAVAVAVAVIGWGMEQADEEDMP